MSAPSLRSVVERCLSGDAPAGLPGARARGLGLGVGVLLLTASLALIAQVETGASSDASVGANLASEAQTVEAVTGPLAGLVIAELRVPRASDADRRRGDVDEDGDVAAWVELVNPGSASVELEGFGLSDRADVPFRWRFPSGLVLAPGRTVRVWLTGKDRALPGRALHAGFSIVPGGATLVLSAPSGTESGLMMDRLRAPTLAAGQSWCRMPYGSASADFRACPASSGTAVER